MFESLFSTTTTATGVGIEAFLIAVASSLVLGLILAWLYMFRSHYTRSFVLTLAVLPAMVCIVIMMVNGNLGAGVAVAGAFSLVRFRSAPGSARDIGFIFLAMAVGLVCGMGYLGYATLVAGIVGGAYALLQAIGFGADSTSAERTLRITVPEDLDTIDSIDAVLDSFTSFHSLTQVKTTNMGSLYRLTYDICLNDVAEQKALIDEIRCHNANLEVSLSQVETNPNEL